MVPATKPVSLVDSVMGAGAARDPNAVLTTMDIQSALWKKIKAHLEDRLAAARLRNDGDKDDAKTAKLRGRIAEIKNLLALEDPAPATTVDTSLE